MGLAALTMAASMFAADFAARVVMEGSLAGGNKADTYIWQLNKKDQQDADALIVSVNGDKAGAQFQLWYNYAGDDAALKVRKTNLWFKPVDMLKITVGDVSSGAWFGNTLDYWKNPCGGSVADYGTWAAKFSSYATVEGSGVMAELTPVEGLVINGGITAGAGNSFMTIKGKTVAAYGIGAKYTLGDIPLTFGATYRDAGKGAAKLISVGALYGNPYADGIHESVNARMRLEAGKLAGITIDNYTRYAAGAFVAAFRAPVTIRLADNDPSYIDWSAKFTYACDGFTPYLLMGSDVDNNGAITLDKNFGKTFEMQIQPGVTLNVGSCALDVAARINVLPGEKHAISWALPFTASVAF